MPRIRQQHILYAGATLFGFFAVPAFYLLNVYHYVSVYRMELAFVVSGVAVAVSALSLAWTGIDGSRVWVGTRLLVLLLMLPVAFASGVFVYDAHDAWKGNDVHWHADFAVVVDGEKQKLIDSDHFCDDALCRKLNHTGTTYFHEHDDGKIHRHGPIQEPADAMLGAFFDGIGGTLNATTLRYPTDEGWINRTETDGDGTLKVLVKQGSGLDRRWCAISPEVEEPCTLHYTGEPVHNPAHYIISPYTHNPLDEIFIVYDDRSIEEALADVRHNGEYRGITTY